MKDKIIIKFEFGCSVCEANTQEFNSTEEAIKWLEDSLDNWYFDSPEYAEEVIYPVLCQVREEEYDEILEDGTKVISIDTSFIE